MNDNFIPLSVPSLKGNELKYLTECVETEWVSSAGSYVDRFAEEIAAYTGSKYAISTSSGTAALHISLILAGIMPDEEVIVPTVTFIAPINTIKYMGARPVFMDCDEYLNIDVEKFADFCQNECEFSKGILINKSTKAAIKAVMPVHVFGNPVNMQILMDIANKYNLAVIEDATESLGSSYRSGKYKNKNTGSIGGLGCYSFNGNKIITSGGGGMIVTDNLEYANSARYLTNQAKDDDVRYIHNKVGYNYRMTNLQAAVGCAQLEQLERYICIKRKNFSIYKEAIDNMEGLDLIGEPAYGFSNFWHYSLLVDKEKFGMDKDNLMGFLSKKGIQTRPLWQLNHMQRPYKGYQAYRIERAFYYYDRLLNMPCSVSLNNVDIKRVIEAIRNA